MSVIKKEVDVSLRDGTETTVQLPEKLPAVTAMNTRDKIKIGVKGQKAEIDNVQKVLNDAQKYLVKNLMDNHTKHSWEELTIDSFDKIWSLYKDQINGKKKESPDTESDTTSKSEEKQGK